MKQWFPLADYEFYAFVAAGIVLIAALDYSFAGGILVNRQSWSVVDLIFWAVIAYLTGQIAATPSSIIIEHLLTRRLLGSPADIQLGFKVRGRVGRVLAECFAPREYAPLTLGVRRRAIDRAAARCKCSSEDLTGEAVFQIAFHPARSNADTSARLDAFLNQYGLCRNMCFVGFVASISLLIHCVHGSTQKDVILFIGSIILSLGMFGRFLKYYSAYSGDVLRSYAVGEDSEVRDEK